jgi:hypothetical protein
MHPTEQRGERRSRQELVLDKAYPVARAAALPLAVAAAGLAVVGSLVSVEWLGMLAVVMLGLAFLSYGAARVMESIAAADLGKLAVGAAIGLLGVGLIAFEIYVAVTPSVATAT